MAELGYFALVVGLFLASYAVLVDLLGAGAKEMGLLESGRNATISCWLCLTVATVALSVSLIRHDFSISYVAEHTSRALPLMYRISALWAGAAGSLLFWLWLQVGIVLIAFSSAAGREKDFAAGARAVTNFVCAFFLIILIADKNPFTLSSPVPADGAGLNPLLQHPAMALHPPTLFIGYAALVIPFAWAFAQLLAVGKLSLHPLFVQARNWTLIGWLFLTVGIVLGAWWAYEELGWGGYWAWDPVENSSLMPWLTATALLHCFRTYRPRTAIAQWLIVLCLATFSLCVFGTFLTRYGLVTSVHAFGEPGLGILFLVLLVLIWIAAGVLLWRQHRHSAADLPATGLPGRKFIGLNNWLMVSLAFVIFVGTLFPFFSGLVTDQKITLKSDYFTKITAPLGLLLLLLLGLCPYLLRHSINRNWRIVSSVLFAIAAVVGWLLTKNLAIPCFIICVSTAVNLAVDLFGRSSAIEKSKPRTYFGKPPAWPLLRSRCGVRPRRTLRWYGARVAHLGVVLIFVGIAGSGAYEIEKQAALSPGQSMAVGKFNIKFEGLKADHGPNFTAVTADVNVSTDGKFVAGLNPSQAYYHNSDKQTSEVDIKRGLSGDIYVALTAVDKSSGLVNLRVLIKPLINWIWIGSGGLVVGATLVLISFYRRKRATP